MSLPKFCYQKAFWLVVGLAVSLVTATTGVIYADLAGDISQNQERSIQNSLKLEKIDADELKLMYRNQILICERLHVDCT